MKTTLKFPKASNKGSEQLLVVLNNKRLFEAESSPTILSQKRVPVWLKSVPGISFKLNSNCYTCGKPGHHRNDCPHNKDGNDKQFKKGPRDIVCVVSESLLADCNSRSWWVDSASSRHVAKTRENFVEMKDVKAGDHKIYMGNNMYCNVLDVGTVKIPLPGQNNLILTDVLYAPNMRRNLLSVPRMDKKGFELHFRSSKVSIGKHGVEAEMIIR
ncbi:hypothetical protein RJ639_012614 [Escallonia herrerae]|uniref:CCHC-type domain-containing protein n=1 Tax=Escallonia herrerae TaxID=1293975 RepID=A0AA89APV3_9ASTE|nr:hypothetical protein RJ639_012614 [Escallonia herrerae]